MLALLACTDPATALISITPNLRSRDLLISDGADDRILAPEPDALLLGAAAISVAALRRRARPTR